MAATTVMRMTVTSHDGVMGGASSMTTTRTVRYSQGWRNTEQDRRPPAHVARVISQDYSVVKRECLEQKALWEDPSFPATDQSIYPSSVGPLPFKWMRPSVSALTKTVSMFRVQYQPANYYAPSLGGGIKR